ncbi:ribose-5-phosphate isomerase RpiA [Virgibacillus salexigens]|uniref:ribose-5-phosphate isomerase RpiA n=1 Tax=Virgibacillus salexigens TaxID=61016 RepID=UPI00190C615B|nr:ribose-5-phosphate isomerase RpiA [Virgibacillus salexigens]
MDYSVINKRAAGEAAVDYIVSGMTVGLGSGSTVDYMLDKLAEKVKEGLKVQGVPTSKKTEKLAKHLGIPIVDFATITKVDLAIDGADEVDPSFHLIKGGGGSLVREKIVDANAQQLIIIIDETKKVPQLGTYPLPIEIVPFGWQKTAEAIAAFGVEPKLRKLSEQDVFVSDNGNYILDCPFKLIEDPHSLHQQLKQLVGVIETGLFTSMADIVIAGEEGKVEKLTKEK